MNIDKNQLEINFNLHSMQPGFLNFELHYIIAESENVFRFVQWDEEAKTGEEKFYCFLTGNPKHISAGNITLKESYELTQQPAFAVLNSYEDFIAPIESVMENRNVAKGIRQFSDNDIEEIRRRLCDKYGDCQQHFVASNEARHILFVIQDIEISISATMVYFRYKAPFSEKHYSEVMQQGDNKDS